MKMWITLLFVLMPTLAHAQAASFRGYWVLERTLGQRLSPSGQVFDLGRYTSDQGLLYLLGYWDSDRSPRIYMNGQANALNMLIYYMSLSALAEDLAANCQGPVRVATNANFAAALKGVCAWPAPEAKSDQALEAFWISLMGYDAPEDEFAAWRDFFKQTTYDGQPASAAVRAMALSIMMNPYFLVND